MCLIQITSVIGSPTTPFPLIVGGTASACDQVIVNVNCNGQDFKLQVNVVNGSWTANFPATCPCGTFVNITAVCVTDPTCGDSFSLPIPCGCCPAIIVSPKFSPCDSNGQRFVQLATQIFVSAGCTPLTIQWDFGNGNFGPTHNFTAPGTYTFTDASYYYPGIYNAVLQIFNPPGCNNFTYTVNVAPCPPVSCCPNVTVNLTNSDCLDNGTIDFTFNTTVQVNSGCPNAIVEWNFGDSTSGTAQTITAGTTQTFSETHNYPISSLPLTATLNVIQPTGCAPTSVIISEPATDDCDCQKPLKKLICKLLEIIALLGLSLAIVCLLLSLCPALSVVQSALLTTAAVAGALGAIALAAYLIFCNKCIPCGFLLLFLWRIFFSVGIVYAIFAACCGGNTNFLIGLGIMLLGVLFLIIWANTCNKNTCEILAEVLYVTGTIIIPSVALILGLNISVISACLYIVPIINIQFWALVTIINGLILAYYLTNC